jgi:hypothetical protein
MTQDQYLDLKPLRIYLDHYASAGSAKISHDHTMIMLRIYQELFSGGFNTWCDGCSKDAFFRLMVEYDKYEAASAPVIVSVGQTAKLNVTKRSRKRNSNFD